MPAVLAPALATAAHLRRDDGVVDKRHRQLLAVLIDPGWRYGAAAG